MKRVFGALILGLLAGCGGGGEDAPELAFFRTPGGYPAVAGEYSVTEQQTANSCGDVDPTPKTFTVTITQSDDLVAQVSDDAPNVAALKAAGWTTSESPATGKVTTNGRFALSRDATMAHATLGTLSLRESITGQFTPIGSRGTGEAIVDYRSGGSCTVKSTFTSVKKL